MLCTYEWSVLTYSRNYMAVIMVHTRNTPDTPDGHLEIESMVDRPRGPATNVQPPPPPNLLAEGLSTYQGLIWKTQIRS